MRGYWQREKLLFSFRMISDTRYRVSACKFGKEGSQGRSDQEANSPVARSPLKPDVPTPLSLRMGECTMTSRLGRKTTVANQAWLLKNSF
jgi:hypothetical protein